MQTQGQQIVARAAFWAATFSAPAAPPVRPQRPSTAQKIADDMLDVAAVRGSCEEEDLLARGWSPVALRRHGAKAREIANAASVRSL